MDILVLISFLAITVLLFVWHMTAKRAAWLDFLLLISRILIQLIRLFVFCGELKCKIGIRINNRKTIFDLADPIADGQLDSSEAKKIEKDI